MFKTSQELMEFITWARKAGIKSFKNETVQFEISEIVIATDASVATPGLDLSTGPSLKVTEEKESSKTMVDVDETADTDYEKDLFWSAQ